MGRTIVVGDIHGCALELDDLLARVKYSQGSDDLILVGDLVARGPDSRGVVDRMLKYGARAVRGNHDEKVLTWWRVARAKGPATAWKSVRLPPRHEAVVRTFETEHFEALDALPLAIPLPAHGILVVHAGLDPSSIASESPEDVLLSIRSVDARGVPTRKLDGKPWASLWKGPEHVVFGHDARRGLQIEHWATGLDTGCCYGRTLTALVLDAGEKVPVPGDERRAKIFAVAARAAYCGMGSGDGPE